jgi:4a-hydroxytetrahydrobiopterin dehydratase
MSSENNLASKHCVPCTGGVPKLEGEALRQFAAQVPGWTVVEGHHLERVTTFRDFKGALAFANAVGAIAEAENHHPELVVTWGRTVVRIWTHKIDGLTEADFVLAAKISELRDAGT